MRTGKARTAAGAAVAVAVVVSMLAAEPAGAHGSAFMGGSAPANVFRELATLFGPDAAFSARVDVVRASGTRPTVHQHLTYHLAAGKLRVDEDINETTGLPAGAAARRKEMGVDVQFRVVHLAPPVTHLIFPRLEAYAAYPAATPATIEIERQTVGEDSVDGVPCLKHRVRLLVAGEPTDYTLWTRKDDPRIPVKLHEAAHDDVTATFHDVRWEPPAATLFEVPKNYARFESLRKVAEAKLPIKRQTGAE